MGVERQLVPLLGLLADREQAHPGPLDAEHLLGEDRAHVTELEQMLGSGLGVGAGIDQDGRPVLGGDHDRDPGPVDDRQAPHVQQARCEHGARVPGRDDGVGIAVTDRADGAHERGVRLEAHRLGRLVVHLDHLARDDVLETVRVEVGRAEDDGLDAVPRGDDGAGDDLLRGMVAPEGVHSDPAAHSTYGAGVPSG